MRPQTGLQLGGRYELMELIAVGGMGEVWQAADLHLDRKVAAKVLRSEFAGDAAFLGRMRTEARNAAGLSHTNVTAMYDYGEQEGAGYLIMELVEGEPMSDLLTRERTLAPNQLLPILAQTARGLHAAHVAGVVHRDVKPSNLLITRDGTVKITDFGIALGANQAPMTAAGMVMGTAQYLPPEQAMGKAAQGVGDIYALGVIAYEALVGRRPFTGTTQVDIAFAHVNQPVPPMPDAVDPRVRDVVMSMLDKDPERRPRSGASLGRMLDALLRELQAEPPSGPAAPGPSHREEIAQLATQAMPTATSDRDRAQLAAEAAATDSARRSAAGRARTGSAGSAGGRSDGARRLASLPPVVGTSALKVEPVPLPELEPPTPLPSPPAPAPRPTRRTRGAAPAERVEGVRRPTPPAVRSRRAAAQAAHGPAVAAPARAATAVESDADESDADDLTPRWEPVRAGERAAPTREAPATRPRRHRHHRGPLTLSWTAVVKVLLVIVMATVLAVWIGTLAQANALTPVVGAAGLAAHLRLPDGCSPVRRRPTSG